ncbi:Excinuclease ABC subunit C [Lachnospiraceae bacterium RM5]|nr:Excinuclease ABC subunit C [Lachnospiraceae bacterium RM5]
MFDFDEELKKLPARPGVYLMHGKNDEIIYVGKAISLKNRVRQYFQTSRKRTDKINMMISNIRWFEYIVTDSEVEALILECNLIKRYHPKYNTMLMDDKAYPFIRISINDDFPKISLAREMKKDNAKYFGPYTSVKDVKDIIEFIAKLYKIRTCNKIIKDGKNTKPCLNYQIKKCLAPCAGFISMSEYRGNIDKAISFLNGNYKDVVKMLEDKMMKASEELRFEDAATYRDLINSVYHISDKQKITSDEYMDRDIISYAIDKNDAIVMVFYERDGKILGREHFYMDVSEDNVIENFIKQYYGNSYRIPKEIFIPEEIDDLETIENLLSLRKGVKVSIKVPKKGKNKGLVELARKNAVIILNRNKDKIINEEKKTVKAVEEIDELLGINYTKRIESFDISNISGFNQVASMVVYEDGKPKKNDYRKFKIKSVTGPDDYSSMKEVLTRRFRHGLEEIDKMKDVNTSKEYGSFTRFPDMILMDGGKGQVNIAISVLSEFNLNIPVCGMVKDDHHRTRGLYFNNQEIAIEKNSEAFKLITRIQDETHRFAITYHRNLRGKEATHSVLDEIKGIGAVRKKALLKKYKSIEELKAASVEELKEIDGMDEKSAKSVFEFFNKK